MADTYRGLTIRIGGDATSLQKALRSVNSSISATEQQLRKMKKALEMDPDNMGAIETNLRLVGQRAVEAQQRLAQLKRSYQEISNQKVELFKGTSAQTIRQLADATEDANARAAEANRNYAEVVEQLARVKNEIKGLTGIDLDDELNPDETVEAMRQLGMVTDDIADKYAHLRSSYQKAFDENEIAKQVAAFSDLEVEITRTDAEAKSLAGRFSELSRASHGIDFGEGIDDQLKRIDKAAESVNDEMRRLDSALKLDDGNVETLALKLRDMQEASTLAERKVDLLRQKLERMDAAGVGKLSDETQDAALAAQKAADEYDEATAAVTKLKGELAELESRQSLLDAKDAAGTDEYRELGEQIRAARTQLDRLVETQREAKAVVDTSAQVTEYRQLQTEISEARAQQSKLNDEMQQMGRFTGVTQGSLVSLGMSLSTTVTPAMVALGHGMIDSANTIDAAYRDMRKTVNGTEQDFDGLRQAAIDFSATHVTSAEQILSIQAIGGELGVATDDLKTFAETVSNLDVATDLNAEEAATALGQLSNIISDLDGDKFPNFADALVRLGNNGASTESAIADVASRIGAMGSIVGMTTPEILAWASTIASTGQGSEAAGTAISRTMSDIETAVANGGDALDAFAEIAGMSADEFAKAWTETPSAAMQSFIEGLVNVEEDGGSAITTLDELGITAVRQVQSIQGLMQMIEGLDDNLEMSRDAWNGVSDEWGEAGDAAREAERKAEGFSGSLSRLQNMAQNVGAELGDSLVPVIDGVTDVLGDLYDTFVGLDDGTKQAIVAVGALAAAMGPLLLLGKGVSEFFGGMADGIRKLSTFKQASKLAGGITDAAKSFGMAEGAAVSFGKVLSGGLVAGGIALAVGGISALVGAYMEAEEHARLTERATDGLADACGRATSDMADAEEEAFDYSESLNKVTEANNDGLEALAALADEFDELNQNTGASMKRLDDAREAVQNYAGKTNLTAVEIGELKSAIDFLNETCGTSYSVLRDSDGAYQVMEDGAVKAKDAIYDLIDAQKLQVQMDAQNQKLGRLYEQREPLEEAYSDALDAELDAYEEYQKALDEYNDERAKGNEAYEQEVHLNDAEAHWRELANATKDAEKSLNSVDDDIELVYGTMGNMEEVAQGSAEGMDAFVKSNSAIQGEIGTSQEAIDAFCEAMEEAGVSTEDLEGMSTTELQRLSKEWAKTGDDVSDILARMGIDITGMAENLRSTFEGMSPDGSLSESLQNMGYDLDQLSVAMSNAGITSGQLYSIGAENFALLAQSAGGDMDRLTWLIQNFNAQPIYNKDGSINVNDVSLYDALGNIYVWNGSELKTIDGYITIQQQEIRDAQGLIYTWNQQGQLVDPTGQVVVDYTQLTLANGEIATYNNGQLVVHDEGKVIVGYDTLVDCNGAMVEYNDTTLKPISGQVNVDYSDVTNAISAIDSLVGRNGSVATVHVRTVRTTVNRVENETVNTGGRSRMSAPSVSTFSRMASVPVPVSRASAEPTPTPVSRVRASGLSDVAQLLASDPGAFAGAARAVVSEAPEARATRARAGRGPASSDSSDVVKAIDGLRRDIEDMQVVLDSGRLVGGISRDMDRALGRIQKRGSLA